MNQPLKRALISAVSDCLCFDPMSQCRHDQAGQKHLVRFLQRRVPLGKQDYRPGVAEAFPTEAEAKNFARSKFGEVDNLTVGTEPSSTEDGDWGGGDS